MNKIFVLLPVFNRWIYTKQCLRSLRNQRYKNFKVVLIDSGSTDKTLDYVQRYYPEVTVITGTTDWWWTRSVEEGARWAVARAGKRDFVLLMNNDCLFGQNYLGQLIKTAEENPKTIVGSLCVDVRDPGVVVEAGARLVWSEGKMYDVSQNQPRNINHYRCKKKLEPVDALSGRGMLIPVEIWKQLGGFDVKHLPHYVADYEFTNRAKRRGYHLVVDPRAIVRNHFEVTGIQFKRGANRGLSYSEAWNLLFSRKSMTNIFDHINFVLVACPKEYRLKNILVILGKVFRGMKRLFPFSYGFNN